MNYYEVALLSRAVGILTYEFGDEIPIGQKVVVGLRGAHLVDGVILAKVEKPSYQTSKIVEIAEETFSKFSIDISKFIANYYCCSLGQALSLFMPSKKSKEASSDFEIIIDDTITLSQSQKNASDEIDKQKVSLLFADTGSGKTEIYIKQILNQLMMQKQSILLMPEISLTPQMEKRLQKIFGKSVAIWHSKVSKVKKTKILQGLASGEISVVAGARSALFLPYNKLGLIIVDEEHDDSYKSETTPRYNAKDLAIYIGSKYDIKVILGSATPSCNTYHKIPAIRLKQTYFETNKNYYFDDSSLEINESIYKKIENVLSQNKQAIIFLPTRANFRYQICDTCGKSVECPFCSVSMSLHKNHKILRCHYCGYSSKIEEKCNFCHDGIIKNFRMGTAEVQELLANRFKNVTIEKFDTDSIKTEKELKRILSDFNDGKISILVGTQMLSKGHDYHNVKLAVILGIDSILAMNSYRAREKAVSLVMQISGRSGRSGFGEVVIQSKNCDFFSHFLTKTDYEDFLKQELEFRTPNYPPFVKIAKILFSHQNHKIAKKNMDKAVEIAKSQEIEIIGFGESPVFKVANKFRYELMIRGVNIAKTLKYLHNVSNFAIVDMDALF